ncbi:hypothetical protein FA13DRAFT_1708881 [Coprinellus micaceus]|uniref:Uncharacterized protein n=1 Tax=Coprinellus micaceus TaxID=71717 RepID=A0A4Y7TFI3_COPMI|nr:hypothetical protein FA13DRAFT_1708881 [Coprinellus micaceus]
MTEYDYSPAAQAAYQAKLRQIAQWTSNVPCHPTQLSNPFVHAPRAPESDFYQSRSDKKKGQRRHGGDRRGGYESDPWDSSSDSDDDGPDRPPTPPASAPIAGGFYNPGWGQPYPPQQPYLSPNVLVPTWNGTQWVYSSPVATATAQAPGYGYQRGRDRERRPDQSRSRSRPKNHRRNSHSVPAAAYASPTYPAQYPTNTQPASTNTTPSAYTSPLPISPGYYGPPPNSAGGYFAPQPQFQGFQVPQPPMISPPAMGPSVSIRSPSGSIYSAGYYGSPAVSGYNVNPYGAPPCDKLRTGPTYGHRGWGPAEEGEGCECERKEREEWEELVWEADGRDVNGVGKWGAYTRKAPGGTVLGTSLASQTGARYSEWTALTVSYRNPSFNWPVRPKPLS